MSFTVAVLPLPLPVTAKVVQFLSLLLRELTILNCCIVPIFHFIRFGWCGCVHCGNLETCCVGGVVTMLDKIVLIECDCSIETVLGFRVG